MSETNQSFRDFPQTELHGPQASPWHSFSQRWNPHPSSLYARKRQQTLLKAALHLTTHFPQAVPQDTFSCAHRTLSTELFPHAQGLLVRNGQAGQGVSSSWQECWVRGCPHGGGGRSHGYVQLMRVPHWIGGRRTVRPQLHTICKNNRMNPIRIFS